MTFAEKPNVIRGIIGQMITDKFGIVTASKLELLAIYIFDNDLFRLMPFGKWVYWLETQGVKVT